MSKQALEEVIKKASSDANFYRNLSGAKSAREVLSHYDLSAEEQNAILNRDREAFAKLGVSRELMRIAEWCTGE